MIKKLMAILLTLCIILMQLPPLQVDALAVTNELKISAELTQWVLDEPTHTLYAISETGKNLLFINSTTMNIEKSLTLSGNPTDIIKDNGRLYVALDNMKQIEIVDMAIKAITGTLYTSSDPYRIVKDGDKIYYTERDQWCNIYEYSLTTDTDHKIYGSKYQPDIAINPNNHILYIGESGYSGSNMIYYSVSDNKFIGKTTYNDRIGFSFPSRDTIFDGTNVYYASRDFNVDDPARYDGDFDSTENIIYVNKGLVYTNKSIYTKDNHIRLGYYGVNVNLVESSDNTLYIYSKDKGSIKRFNDSGNLINSSNVISLIPGSRATTIQNTEQSTQMNLGMSSLQMKSKLIQWVMDEPTNTIYGISKEDKTLFFINAQTLNLEKSLAFTSGPTDIIKDSGNLYIALDDVNQIAVIDMDSRTSTGTLYTSSDPYRIEKDGDKIYYTERDQFCNIYEYNLITNTEHIISGLGTVYNPDIAINPEDHILYIGESGSSGSDMIYYSTTDNKVIGKTDYDGGYGIPGYGFPYPGRYIIFDGEKVYYAGYDFDKQNPTHILGHYGKEDIIFAKYGAVLTKTSVYDSASHALIASGSNVNLYEISDELITYYYSEMEKAILRVDSTKIWAVRFNSQGGSAVKDIIVDKNTLIKAPTAPTKAGYTFGGWYKEAACVHPWNIATDKVVSNTILYAKWIIAGPSVPTLAKAVSSSYNSISVSWGAVTGAAGYELYRATSSTGTYSLLATRTTTSYNNTALAAGTTYYYKVRAYRLVGTTKMYGNFTTILSAKPVPSVPVNFTAVRASSTSIKLTWIGVTGASGYEVYRSTYSTGTYSLVKSTTTLYSANTSLKKGTTYYYKVRSYRNVGKTKVYSGWTVVKYARP
jgi:uncharacterized repeat protein (TIGR02543 family)